MTAAPTLQEDKNEEKKGVNVLKEASDEEIHALVDAFQPMDDGDQDIVELSDEDLVIVEEAPDSGERSTQETREEIAELMSADLFIDEPTIEDGGQSETLAESLVTFELPGGIEGAAATSMAGYKFELDKKTKQPKNRNEDRVYINPQTGFILAADGMGGGELGERAAQGLVEYTAENEDVKGAAVKLSQELASVSGGSNDGVCFLSIRPKLNQPIETHQSGDLSMYHVSGDGKTKFRPGDYLKLGVKPQSPMDQFESFAVKGYSKEQICKELNIPVEQIDKFPAIRDIVERIVSGTRPFVTPDNPMYTTLRKSVLRAITASKQEVAAFQTAERFEENDRLLIMSDGVSDNFTEEEIETFMGNMIRYGWSPAEAVKKISKELQRRIELAAKQDPAAKQNHYKLDNATIVILQAPKSATERAA